jgi:hypothetical protein
VEIVDYHGRRGAWAGNSNPFRRARCSRRSS